MPFNIEKESKEKQCIEILLTTVIDRLKELYDFGHEFHKEFYFDKVLNNGKREWRSDFFIFIDDKPALAVEYEGLFADKKYNSNNTGKSGHTTVQGYISNCDKYNALSVMGIPLLRYTADHVKEQYLIEEQIENILIKFLEEEING
jgi:hypothetical protein